LGHSNHIRERLRLHLLHDVSAMKFDCSFAGNQLAGDLFVEQAQYQKSQHLSLARLLTSTSADLRRIVTFSQCTSLV